MTVQSDFLKTKAYIDGKWVSSASSKTFAVFNPASAEVICSTMDCGKTDAESAIEASQAALKEWKARPASERGDLLRAWHALIVKHEAELARLMTAEQGKPLAEARAEIQYGANYIKWFAAEAERIYGDVIPGPSASQRVLVTKEPVGVVAAITPWNFPVAMITRKVAPALAAGCTVIVKPPEDTPLSALAVAALAHEAGIPAGVINVLPTSDPKPVTEALMESSVVRKLSFTGSTKVGKLLMEQSAKTLKKLSLELGGNAPFIVFQDADIAGAVAGAMRSKFRNAGQTCICANRFFIHESVQKTFIEGLKTGMEDLVVGPGDNKDVAIGPLINQAAVEKVERLIKDAVAKGAEVLMGGGRHQLGGNFFQPTLLLGVTPKMQISQEEIFGPVVAISSFFDEADAIKMANNVPVGLAAYFYGNDQARIWRVAEALEYGMVGINTGAISNVAAPFGGVKESGFGREGSKYGIEEYLVTKYLCWQTGRNGC